MCLRCDFCFLILFCVDTVKITASCISLNRDIFVASRYSVSGTDFMSTNKASFVQV
ncbi:hypothetical protein KC19_VG038600 [Ceratodon purpureus]|uniref:Uncharacterized protein n=1 Tax=Ceratodon purpureus TaxID=3225 RepID=A0A8T0HLN9_CERPU|nr:hypothetical protein KC19_VG038600 [Ceratodon purpureus]